MSIYFSTFLAAAEGRVRSAQTAGKPFLFPKQHHCRGQVLRFLRISLSNRAHACIGGVKVLPDVHELASFANRLTLLSISTTFIRPAQEIIVNKEGMLSPDAVSS